MIRKVLIANRGEIACRIIRTCQALGLATVAVYSQADERALYVEMADEAIALGGHLPSESYLDQAKIIQAALRSGADAIHPGYGFLAENATFAYQVRVNGLTFIGPSPEAIEAMGDKRVAKLILQGVPYVPGYIGDDQSDAALIEAAQTIGAPIMIKATAGGGGRGMRLVNDLAALPEALAAARREAEQAFGNPSLMLEKAITVPRHIEVQVFGDQHGHVIALGERECSVQRRHQKIIEESPSTALTPELRQRMCETAISIARQIGYSSAGTVEFLLDSDGNYYFMEMNTRLQVEHPVTEMIYGLDLVRLQIEVARGRSLAELIDLDALRPQGHAIEVRVCAEDPQNNFLPVVGRILHWEAPPYVRTDSGVRSGDLVTPYYDSMIAKVIAHGETRSEAIRKLDVALARLQLLGIKNNVNYLRRVLMSDDHLGGILSTRFIDDHPELLPEPPQRVPLALIACALAQDDLSQHWRNNPNRAIRQRFRQDGETHEVALSPQGQGVYQASILEQTYTVQVIAQDSPRFILVVDGHRQPVTVVCGQTNEWWVHTLRGTLVLQWLSPFPAPQASAEAGGSLRAPMTGQVRRVLVEVGQVVKSGDLLMILEAMKMEHRIEAPHDGTVEAIRYQVGETVQQDEVLLALS
ncbi:MAG: biotin/lipoyl-binding protein [Anaerolineae bacterium]|nr:biotin/lipoyl-binding protein [Anaerolineae bacterium]MDW8173931.1 biotin carboxylase N-terminal domain-containing protein [Anaerolineae bacterium]